MSLTVAGVGLSTRATRAEVDELLGRLLHVARLSIDDLAAVATRARFVHDGRLDVGPPVIGVDDALLLVDFPSPRRHGFAARVAEGCALLGAGSGSSLVAGPIRSAHSTAALATCARVEKIR